MCRKLNSDSHRENAPGGTMSQRIRSSCVASLVIVLASRAAAPAQAAEVTKPLAPRAPLTVKAAAIADEAGAGAVQEPETAPTAASVTETHKSFWKSPQGIIAGVLLAGGLGWVIYSKSHDRVKSPGNP
jgi:hypothetical protein